MQFHTLCFLTVSLALPCAAQTSKQSWVVIEDSTANGGCKFSYLSPVSKVSPSHLRFWFLNECKQETSKEINGRQITYTGMEARLYLNCNKEEYWLEVGSYKNSKGQTLATDRPKAMGQEIDGPTQEIMKVGGSVLSPAHPVGVVAQKFCPK